MPSLPKVQKVHPSATRPSRLWRDPPLSAPSSRRVWLFRVSQCHQLPYQEILSMSSKQYSFLTLPLTSLNQIFIHLLNFLLNNFKMGRGFRSLTAYTYPKSVSRPIEKDLGLAENVRSNFRIIVANGANQHGNV